MDGITQLRTNRGPQQVTFAEVADHLFDYVEAFGEDRTVVERLARFLVAVEAIPHNHDADPHRGLPRAARAALASFI